jgi:membrane protease YdiL (CAAX protease family)
VTRAVVRAPVLSFVILAFAISWAIWTPLLSGPDGVSGTAAWVLYFSGVIGPAAAAFLCAALGSEVTPAALLRRLLHWRAPLRWYAVAILLPFAIRAMAVLVVLSTQGSWRVALRPLQSIAAITVLMLVLVPLEEIGWRGYLLPLLQRRHTFLGASVLAGGIWALWHLPLAWASVGYQRSDEPWRYMGWFVITIVPVSCLLTWLFQRSGESVPVASLFHLAVNLADCVLVLPSGTGQSVLLATAIVGMVVVGVVIRVPRVPRSSSE